MNPSTPDIRNEVAPEPSTTQTGATGMEATASVTVPENFEIESLADFSDEGETGWNAQRRADLARKMQRIAAGSANNYSESDLVGAVVRAEEGVRR